MRMTRAAAVVARIQTEEAAVPRLWWFEVRNILVVNQRRKRIAEADASGLLREPSRLRIQVDREPEESAVLTLARSHRLSVYDASYLELALRRIVPLATLDRELATAAEAEGIESIGASRRRNLPARRPV